MTTSETHKIRPAGRHLLTIGRDLIQGQAAAIAELVKNAYDADSPDVTISFAAPSKQEGYTLCVEDHGHGMTKDTVINKWLVPSTSDKVKRRVSPSGRQMQGYKGIGRYAASILGHDLLLETTTQDATKTTVFLEWEDFENADYLDDVDILVETESNVDEASGTRLTIRGSLKQQNYWKEKGIDELTYELKKIKSPFNRIVEEKDDFRIILSMENFLENQVGPIVSEIQPYEIINFYDYRISGYIESDGTGRLEYSSQKLKNLLSEEIPIELETPTHCGRLEFDIRVYDREASAIETLIKRGLKNESGAYVGKLDARRLLNAYNGIGVYRNGFRVRPLGDGDFDWLKLNMKKVQNPSLKIGSNQAIGYVQVQSEQESGLIEKSARDGFSENHAYERLKYITSFVITKLEERRFKLRRKEGIGRKTVKLEREISNLFDYSKLKKDLKAKLSKEDLSAEIVDEVLEAIGKEEQEKNKIAETIRSTVAIYQGQATLGKIVYVLLHEGRRPLNFFKNQVPNIFKWKERYEKSKEQSYMDKILDRLEGIRLNTDIFVRLFGRIDPLASNRRGKRKELYLKEELDNSLSVFREKLDHLEIDVEISCPEDLTLTCWQEDLYAIFVNLVDNSLFWLENSRSKEKKIIIQVASDKHQLQHVDYRDTGPGIDPQLLESELIFEPEFTTKPDSGTGLGLAIAGEAATRSGLTLKAFESKHGAYFRLEPTSEGNNES